jgi:hypothetical protein
MLTVLRVTPVTIPDSFERLTYRKQSTYTAGEAEAENE